MPVLATILSGKTDRFLSQAHRETVAEGGKGNISAWKGWGVLEGSSGKLGLWSSFAVGAVQGAVWV